MNQTEKEAWDEYERDYKRAPMTWKTWAILAVSVWATYVFVTGLNTIFGN